MQTAIPASSLRGFTAACTELGLDPARLCVEAGLDGLDEQSNAPIPSDQSTKLLNLAQQRSGCDHFALLMAQLQGSNTYEALGPLALLLSSAATLGDTWHIAESYYQALRNRDIYWYLAEAGNKLQMQFAYQSENAAPLAIELTLARFFKWNRAVTGGQWQPQAVYLRRPAPAKPQPYQQFFKRPLVFNAEFDGFLLERNDLQIPLISADAVLHETLVLQLKDPEKFASRNLGEQVRFYITQGFANDDYQLPAIADKLGMIPRMLQRKLADDGIKFQTLLTDARLQLSRYYLQHTDLSLREIALRVGFQNPGTFSSFFKAQQGVTPYHWRKCTRSSESSIGVN